MFKETDKNASVEANKSKNLLFGVMEGEFIIPCSFDKPLSEFEAEFYEE